MHHFSSELKAASIRSGHGYSLSDLGPIVVVFHETLHTEILRQHEDRSPEDSLRRRFQSLNLSTEAYSAFEYVGTRTSNPPTSFRGLKSSVERHIQNSTVRSARSISVIFNALKVCVDCCDVMCLNDNCYSNLMSLASNHDSFSMKSSVETSRNRYPTLFPMSTSHVLFSVCHAGRNV